MKVTKLFKGLLLATLFVVIGFVAKAQPTCEIAVTNIVLETPNTYRFDVFLLRTGATPLQLNQIQFSLGIDVTVINGGTLGISLDPGSSQLFPAQTPPAPALGGPTSVLGGITYRFINQAGAANPGAGNGTIISNVKTCASPGTRIGSYTLTNTQPFAPSSHMNHQFSITAASGRIATTVTNFNGAASQTSTLTRINYNTVGTCDPNLTLNAPVCPTILSSGATPVSCFGGTNGTASLSLSGATSPTYTIDAVPSNTTGASSGVFTGLPAGSYIISYVDGSCNGSTGTLVVGSPASAVSGSITSQTNNLCFGNTNGSATVTAAGGTGAYTYLWSPSGGSAATASGLATGSYSVLITDANGCNTSVPVTITGPASAVSGSVTSQTNPLCFGNVTGTATVAGAGGTGAYTYLWSPSGGSAATASGLAAGNYSVLITDANGCTFNQPVTITEPSELQGSASFAPLASCGGTTNVTISATGGTGTISGTGVFAQGAGSVNYTVTDANGCTDVVTVVVTSPGGPTVGISAQTNVLCFGQATGSATVSATGGTSPYTYLWSNGQTTATATGLAAGTYSVTVTDNVGCASGASATITEPATAVSGSVTAQTNVLCFGNSTGSATVAGAGGTPGYTYLWSPSGGSAATATGLAAGNYSVAITDANGCSFNQAVTISQPATAVSGSVTAQTNVLCFGNSTGSATVAGAGGTGAYSYSWSPSGGSAATASGLAAGNYSVLITDANGCTTSVPVTISQPAAALAAAQTHSNASCFGVSDGSATITATGGTTPYGGTGTFTGLAAGTYNYTVTDANGCTSSVSVTITQPAFIAAPTISVVNNGNGTYNLTAGNLAGGASVLWSTTQTSVTITVAPGTYSVTQSVGGCSSASTSVTISGDITSDPAVIGTYLTDLADASVNPNTLLFGTTYKLNVPLFNLSQDNIIPALSTKLVIDLGSKMELAPGFVLTSAGLNAYFTWSSAIVGGHRIITGVQNGAIPPDFIDQAVFNVVGTLSCTSTIVANWNVDNSQGGSLFLIDEDPLNNNTTIQYNHPVTVSATPVHVTCFGAANGNIIPVSSPGTTIVIRNASNQVVTAPFGPGVYTVTATANGDNPVGSTCSNSTTVTITQPATAVSASSTGTNVSCFNGSNGTATAVGAGGTPGYTYLWNSTPAQATALATGLVAGTYTCTVTDANGCITTTSYTVTQPTAVTASATGTNVNCFGNSTGTATVTAGGGTPGYTYLWSPSGGTAATATGLAAGTYTCTVTDANGCSVLAAYTVTQPAGALAATASGTNVSCFGGSNGTATASATGGTAPYTYSWSPSGGTAAIATGLAAGTYTCTITDALGCFTTASYTVTAPTSGLSTTNAVTNVSCFGGTNGSITTTATGGTAPYTYSWNTTPIAQTTATAGTLIAGTYTVTVTDAMGCTTTATSTVGQPAVLTSTGTFANVSCFGGSNGSATVTAIGGTPGYTYSWSPSGGTGITASGLSAGVYTVTITDANGCQRQQSFTIAQPTALTSTATTVNVSCNGGTNGSASVTVSGGTTPYSYVWNTTPAQTTATASGLGAGSYTVTVTDANGCSLTATYSVIEPAVLAATGSGTNISCFGSTTGSATASVTGGTAPYSYSWNTSPVQTTATATGLGAGIYTCNITDAHGCTTSTSYTVTQSSAPLNVAMSFTNVICFNASNGTGTATVTGGTAPYMYSWSTIPAQSTATATGLAPGTYTVTVTDAGGCIQTGSVTISQPSGGVTAAITASTNVTCFGFNNGSATVTAAGGTAPYTYSWSPSGGTAATATGLAPGLYTVTVTDAGGCMATASYTVTQPAAALAITTSNVIQNLCHNGLEGSITGTATGGTIGSGYAYTITGVPAVTNTTGAVTGIFTGLPAGGVYTVSVSDANGCSASSSTVTLVNPGGLLPDIALGADFTDNFFPTNGVAQTIVFNVAEVGRNPAIGDTIRIIKPSGYTFSFNTSATNQLVGVTNYILDNTNWKMDASNPAFVSIIYDPVHNSTPGVLYCGSLVRVSVTMTRNTPNISTFSLSSRLRKCGTTPANSESNLANNLNSILFTSE